MELEEKEYYERDLNAIRINRTYPNDQELGALIRKYKSKMQITKRFPNDQDLGKEFRKFTIERFNDFNKKKFDDNLFV